MVPLSNFDLLIKVIDVNSECSKKDRVIKMDSYLWNQAAKVKKEDLS